MKQLLSRLTKVINVKNLIALIAIFIYCSLILNEKIDITIFTGVILITIYYFRQNTDKQIIK